MSPPGSPAVQEDTGRSLGRPSRVPSGPPKGLYEGRTLGGFQLSREMARGGMASVYLAHRTLYPGVSQTAAVKVIHPHLARDPDFVHMFVDEARVASSVSHPNVCRVFDFGKTDDTYYLAMEYVVGETWARVLGRLREIPEAEKIIDAILIHVIAQACEGLHAAHEVCDQGGTPLQIVHRDISPQNLMIGYDGSVRVIDFGVASALGEMHTTGIGKLKGHLSYMAPEQMRGQPFDRRADLWSLGVVLWEGLARSRLFRRDSEPGTVLAVTFDPLPSLADCGHAVPASLQRIAERALERDPERRYRSARELSLELSRYATASNARMGMSEVAVWMQSLFSDSI